MSKKKVANCLLGGALGDALGYVVEFKSLTEIVEVYGSKGITELEIDKSINRALISDDTQMTLFTVEGILNSEGNEVLKSIGESYMRWFYTQEGKLPRNVDSSILDNNKVNIIENKGLFASRYPGRACITSLRNINKYGLVAKNDSKGCGGVMRVAPTGLYYNTNPELAFKVAFDCARITHGHATSSISSGAMAYIIAKVYNGEKLIDVVKEVDNYIEKVYETDGLETINSIRKSIYHYENNSKPIEAITSIGGGWIAEEALGIAIYCALKSKGDLVTGLRLAVNHSGDSDSTGAICGNIIGAMEECKYVPIDWVESLELSELIILLSDKLYNSIESNKNKVESVRSKLFTHLEINRAEEEVKECVDTDKEIKAYIRKCKVLGIKPLDIGKIDGKMAILKADKSIEYCKIPNFIQAIGQGAFRDCKNIESILLPDSLIEIQDSAFYGCSKLKEINIPSGVRVIEDRAFKLCTSLRRIKLENVEYIQSMAFSGCSKLKEVDLGKKLLQVERNVFYSCSSLKEIYIPDTIVDIEGDIIGEGYSNELKLILPKRFKTDLNNMLKNKEIKIQYY